MGETTNLNWCRIGFQSEFYVQMLHRFLSHYIVILVYGLWTSMLQKWSIRDLGKIGV